MNRHRKSFIILINSLVFFYLSIFNTYGQTDNVLDKLLMRLDKLNTSYPQEKIYIHFDKPFYFSGETIWFKAYLVYANGNLPSPLSNIIYTELLDMNGKVILQNILKASNGFANGDFVLPDTIPQGKYMVRAYTNWMRNFNQNFLFCKEILLFDSKKTTSKMEPDSLDQMKRMVSEQGPIDLQFFPESGYLAYGLTSKVAFKAIDETGKGIHVKGKIANQDGIEVSTFESFHLGMGAFFLNPEKGNTYSAYIIDGHNNRISYPLPVPVDEGIIMTVDNSPIDAIRIVVQANRAFLRKKSKEVLLVVQAAGTIYYKANGNLNRNSSFAATIPKKDLPAGITQLTLFNAEGKPESERLVFINRRNALQVKIETDKLTYEPREKVQLEISTIDYEGNPVEGNFSLTVTDASQVAEIEKYSENILTSLLLSSDLQGNIEQPGYYFAKENTNADSELDLLMLTQGWRRFIWKEILDNNWPEIKYNYEKSLMNRKGLVFDSIRESPVKSLQVSFYNLNRNKSYNRFTDKKGNFYFYTSPSNGNELLFFDASDTSGNHDKYKIKIINDIPEFKLLNKSDVVFENQLIEKYIKKRKERDQIEASFNYSAERSIFIEPEKDIVERGKITAEVPGYADITVELDEYISFPTVSEVFREIVS